MFRRILGLLVTAMNPIECRIVALAVFLPNLDTKVGY